MQKIRRIEPMRLSFCEHSFSRKGVRQAHRGREFDDLPVDDRSLFFSSPWTPALGDCVRRPRQTLRDASFHFLTDESCEERGPRVTALLLLSGCQQIDISG